VKSAGLIVCPDDRAEKPKDDKPGNGGGGGGDTGGPGNTNGQGNGGGQGGSTPEEQPGTGTSPGNGNANGHGDKDQRGNGGGRGNGGRGNGGNGNGNGNGNNGNNGNAGTPGGPQAGCVKPPAAPAANAVAGDGQLPPARAGTSVNVEPVEGTVAVKEPKSGKFQPLNASDHIPEGSIIDARAGTIELTSARHGTAGQQTAAFSGAKFEIRQEKQQPVTDIVLRGGDFRGCPRPSHDQRAQQVRNGVIAARTGRGGSRGLWGNGRGRFRTRGRWGSATVRGTVWRVEDTCGGTRTTVARGRVDVMDFGLNRSVSVRSGQTYLAKVRR
jgi:hypothetical protein